MTQIRLICADFFNRKCTEQAQRNEGYISDFPLLSLRNLTLTLRLKKLFGSRALQYLSEIYSSTKIRANQFNQCHLCATNYKNLRSIF
jgi:hypothetical protein